MRNGKTQVDLAATGDVHHAIDIVKLLMAGANVIMVCSPLLRQGNPITCHDAPTSLPLSP